MVRGRMVVNWSLPGRICSSRVYVWREVEWCVSAREKGRTEDEDKEGSTEMKDGLLDKEGKQGSQRRASRIKDSRMDAMC